MNKLEGHSRSSELPLFGRLYSVYHFLLVIIVTPTLSCTVSNILSLYSVPCTASDRQKSYSFQKTVEITNKPNELPVRV